MTTMINGKLLRFIFFFTLACLSIASARADHPGVSNVYDVAFAYARLTGTTPNFMVLLKTDPYWKSLNNLDQMRQQNARLNELSDRFAGYSPTTTPIIVRTPVRVHLVKKPTALVLGYRSTNLPYFPFWDGTRLLTIYTEDLPLLYVLPVEDDLALKRAGYLIDDENMLYLDLIPDGRPARQSTRLDGEPQILIPARIAQARLLNEGDQTIWSWVNPAYDYLYRRTINRF